MSNNQRNQWEEWSRRSIQCGRALTASAARVAASARENFMVVAEKRITKLPV